jgi:ABC-type phosphate/phosphonate transport system substrate-binding protein
MSPNRLSLLMLVAVLALALWSIYPTGPAPIPGVLEMAVLTGRGELATSRALQPLAEYLAASARRTVELKLVDSLADLHDADLALVPTTFAESWQGSETLAWAKTLMATGGGSRPMYLYPRSAVWFEKAEPRVIYGDPHSWSGGRGAGDYLRQNGFDPRVAKERVHAAVDVYDHREAIAALVHGAYDLAIVRETDLMEAVGSGLVDRREFAFGPAGPSKPCFALVASPQLAPAARRSLRSAALNLDTLRFDRSSLRVRNVLAAMAQLRLAGFVPVEPLPGLRP